MVSKEKEVRAMGSYAELEKLSGNEIVKMAMSDSKTTQNKLFRRMGYKGQGTVSKMINSTRMSLDSFSGMLSAMGYEVVVRKASVDEDTGEIVKTDMWKVEAPEFDFDSEE